MFGYIYKTTNLINGKIYVGKHEASAFDTSYIGSGVVFSKALKKYGKKNFKCELIEAVDSKEDLNIREKFWITRFKARDTKIGYNINKGGEGNQGYKHTAECKAALSEKKKKYKWYHKGDVYTTIADGDTIPEGYVLGKPPVTNKTKEKISNTIKSKNLKAYKNDILKQTIYLGPKDEIPEGYIPGRYIDPEKEIIRREKLRQAGLQQTPIKHTEESKARISAAHSGTKYYTNGENNIRLRPGDPVPEGFYLGRTDTAAMHAGRKAGAEKLKGHPVSDYTRMRSSQAHLGVTPVNAKKVFCEDTNTLYTSISSASKDTTVPASYIQKALKIQDKAVVKYKGKQYTFEVRYE